VTLGLDGQVTERFFVATHKKSVFLRYSFLFSA